MKKIYLTIVIASISFLGMTQSHEQGNLVFNINAGFGIYGADYDAPNSEDDFKSPLAFGLCPIKLEYGLQERISLGVLVQPFGIKFEDPDSDNKIQVRGILIAPSLNYHFTPDAKTDFYIGLAPGYVSSVWKAENSNEKEEARFNGFGLKLDLGTRFYFGGKVSLNLNLAYATYNTNLNDYEENGVTAQSPKGKLRFRGLEPSIGLGFKI